MQTETLSHNLNYKAISQKLSADKWEVAIFNWKEDSDEDSESFWELAAGPWMFENAQEAQDQAEEHLGLLSGEILIKNIPVELDAMIETLIGHREFFFFEPQNYEVEFLETPDELDNPEYSEVSPLLILAIDQFYFIQSKEGPWMAAFQYEAGKLRAWQKFENLPLAIQKVILGEFPEEDPF